MTMNIRVTETLETFCDAGDITITFKADCFTISDAKRCQELLLEIDAVLSKFEEKYPITDAGIPTNEEVKREMEVVHAACKPHDVKLGPHHDPDCELYIEF